MLRDESFWTIGGSEAERRSLVAGMGAACAPVSMQSCKFVVVDVSCCVFFFANCIVRTATSSDKVQIPWQAWNIARVMLHGRGSIWRRSVECGKSFCVAGAVYLGHFILYTPSTLHTLHSALYTLNFTLYTLNFKLHSLHFAPHTVHSTRDTPDCPLSTLPRAMH